MHIPRRVIVVITGGLLALPSAISAEQVTTNTTSQQLPVNALNEPSPAPTVPQPPANALDKHVPSPGDFTKQVPQQGYPDQNEIIAQQRELIDLLKAKIERLEQENLALKNDLLNAKNK